MNLWKYPQTCRTGPTSQSPTLMIADVLKCSLRPWAHQLTQDQSHTQVEGYSLNLVDSLSSEQLAACLALGPVIGMT